MSLKKILAEPHRLENKNQPPERGFSVVGNSLVGKSRCQGLPKATSLLATSVAQSSFTALVT